MSILLVLLPLQGQAHPGFGGGISGGLLQGEDYTTPYGAVCDPDPDGEHVEPRTVNGVVVAALVRAECGIEYSSLTVPTWSRITGVRGLMQFGAPGTLTIAVNDRVLSTTVVPGNNNFATFTLTSPITLHPGIHKIVVTHTNSASSQYDFYLDYLTLETDLPPQCNDLVPDPNVVFCLDPGEVIDTFRLVEPTDGGIHNLTAYVQNYRFFLNGIPLSVPCVIMKVDGGTLNPCEEAGGLPLNVLAGLSQEVREREVKEGDEVVSVCEALLVATVLGAGVEGAPSWTVC